jgi:hypothetical protein
MSYANKKYLQIYYISLKICIKNMNVKLLNYIQGGSNMTGTNCDLFTHK